MSSFSSYFFIELFILVFLIGFFWEYWSLKELFSKKLWLPASLLACFWFVIDQLAVRLGLWTFPPTGTLPGRILSLPIEEYVLFFLHTLVCFILLKHLSGIEDG